MKVYFRKILLVVLLCCVLGFIFYPLKIGLLKLIEVNDCFAKFLKTGILSLVNCPNFLFNFDRVEGESVT